MLRLTEIAYAKLNLTLDILGALPGGYHELCSVMQSVSLADILTVTAESGSGQIEVTTDKSYLPIGEKNLAGRAARVFLNEADIKDRDIRIDITKNIPVGAGLGGGSSDAAAVLRGMNRLFGSPFSREKLEEMGAAVGSDVPFCVRCGTVLAGGRGELMRDIPPFNGGAFVLCKPDFSVSTAQLFKMADEREIKVRPDTDGLITALESNNVRGVAARLYNVFEEVMVRGRAEVKEIRGELFDNGALGASMSGTGPTVFGVFPDLASAERAAENMRKSWKICIPCEPVAKVLSK